MSLINDVLRDLEKRERREHAAPAAVQAAFGSRPATRPPSIRVWVSLGLLILIICALLAWWLRPEPVSNIAVIAKPSAGKPATPHPEPAATAPVAPLPPNAAAQTEPVSASLPASATEPVAASQPEPVAEFSSAQPAVVQSEQPAPESEPRPEQTAEPVVPVAPQPAPAVTTAVAVVQPFVAATATVDHVNSPPQSAAPVVANTSASIHIRRHTAPAVGNTTSTGVAAAVTPPLVSLEPVQQALHQGLRQQAAQQLHGILQTQPEHTEARMLLARTFLLQQRPQDALQVLQANIGDAPQPEFDLLLAASLREAGEQQQAAQIYQRLILQYPASSQARLGLALSQEAAGQWQAAAGNYQLLLNQPDRRTAQLARQRLIVLQQSPAQSSTPATPLTRERTSNP